MGVLSLADDVDCCCSILFVVADFFGDIDIGKWSPFLLMLILGLVVFFSPALLLLQPSNDCFFLFFDGLMIFFCGKKSNLNTCRHICAYTVSSCS